MESAAQPLLWVFLGNPGTKYERTRHNLGYMVARRILDDYPAGPLREKFKGLYWAGRLRERRLALLLPHTFMNSSGESVAAAVRSQGLSPEQVAVAHDDIDLAFGRLRIRAGGSAGGHKGVESIIQELGTAEFLRIKLGVGRPPAGVDPIDFVLSEFHDDEWPAVERMLERAVRALLDLLKEPLDRVMNAYNIPSEGQ